MLQLIHPAYRHFHLLLVFGAVERCLLPLQRCQALLLAAGQADKQAAQNTALQSGRRRGVRRVENEGREEGRGHILRRLKRVENEGKGGR